MIRIDDSTTLRVDGAADAFGALRRREAEIAADRADDQAEDHRLQRRRDEVGETRSARRRGWK